MSVTLDLAVLRSRWRRPATVLAVAVAVGVATIVLLVVRDSSTERVRRAVDTTLASGSAAATIVTSTNELPLVGALTLAVARGELDLNGGDARLIRDIPVLDTAELELRYADGGAWVRLPLPGRRAWPGVRGTGPGSWIQLDAEDVGTGASAPALGNPTALLALLETFNGAPEALGEAELANVRVARYRILVDLDRAARLLPEPLDELAMRLRRLRGASDLPLELWIDEQELIRRIRYQTSIDVAGLTAAMLITDIDLDRFGEPVEITAPPPDQLISPPTDQLDDLDLLDRLREFLRR